MLAALLSLALAADPHEGFLSWSRQQGRADDALGVSEGYLHAAEAFARIATVVADKPGVVVPEELGRSLGDRPIWAFRVAAPGAPVERDVLVVASIHALEWISLDVAVEALEQYAADPLPGVSVTFVPLLNPDGRAKVEADLAAGRNAYRRGNERNVDLNRDFAVNREATSIWHGILPGYHATSPAPLSQPESRALDALADRERFDRAVSLHSFGGFLYHPWTGRWRRPPDWGRFVALGRAMEDAQGHRAYRTRQLSRWGFFFRAHGSEIDHLYGQYGTLAFLIELTQSGIEPFHTATLRSYFRWYNPRDPTRHRELGARAVRALIRSDAATP